MTCTSRSRDFGIGLILAVVLVYLILMAQFASFSDPFIILLAIPPGLSGVVLFLLVTGTTLNVMSLMGVIMMTGIVVSNSILIVEFAAILHEARACCWQDALVEPANFVLRPILMTTLATLLGIIPMALGSRPAANNTRRWREPSSADWRFGGCDRVPGAGGLPDHSPPHEKQRRKRWR